jgi:hydrogenase nickel incorporation protein HypB
MFTICDVPLINKIDYLDYEDFDMDAVRERVLNLNSKIRIMEVSCKTGQGIDTWITWLKDEIHPCIGR